MFRLLDPCDTDYWAGRETLRREAAAPAERRRHERRSLDRPGYLVVDRGSGYDFRGAIQVRLRDLSRAGLSIRSRQRVIAADRLLVVMPHGAGSVERAVAAIYRRRHPSGDWVTGLRFLPTERDATGGN